jgi:hypothetical protein
VRRLWAGRLRGCAWMLQLPRSRRLEVVRRLGCTCHLLPKCGLLLRCKMRWLLRARRAMLSWRQVLLRLLLCVQTVHAGSVLLPMLWALWRRLLRSSVLLVLSKHVRLMHT